MPRTDKTFSDNDILRFYCQNLTPDEKENVLDAFRKLILKGESFCPDDSSDIDFCQWADYLDTAVRYCEDTAAVLKFIIKGMAVLEVVLTGLSWLGPLGRFAAILRAIIAYLTEFLIYIAALLIMISDLRPFTNALKKMLCDGEMPDSIGSPTYKNIPEMPGTHISEYFDAFQPSTEEISKRYEGSW